MEPIKDATFPKAPENESKKSEGSAIPEQKEEYKHYYQPRGYYGRRGRGRWRGGYSCHDNQGEYKKKEEFTHFISIPLNYPVILEKVGKLMSDILAKKYPGISAKVFAKKETMHVTILMLTLTTPEMLELAKKAIISTTDKIKEILSKNPLKLSLQKLSCIANHDDPTKTRVLYVKLSDGNNLEILKSISNVLISAMLEHKVISEKELSHIEKKEGKYYPETFHITLMNSTFLHQGKFCTFDAKPVLEGFGESDLGEITAEAIHISTRFSYDEKGFYKPLYIMPLEKH